MSRRRRKSRKLALLARTFNRQMFTVEGSAADLGAGLAALATG
jgi:hypothetical protein